MEFLTQCQQIANQYFGIKNLHQAQKEVFNLMIQNPFVLATLPTGSGKTLLYAVPSLIFNEGPILVISPLISLMRDQMRRMQSANIGAVLFTSEQSEEERFQSYQDLWNSNTKIIFVSPERFVLPSFLEKIARLTPSMFVIDEAHCVVSWGHQFRPEYSEIGKSLSQLNPPRILALTATASATTRAEMILKIFPQQISVSQYISRPIGPHIFVKSRRAFSFEEQRQTLVDILQTTQSQKSIVYFSTRKQCEEFGKLLKQKKLHTVVYHAGLLKEMRSRIEQYIYHTEQKIVVCATTAFGLGIDIPDVRLVIVYGFPSNIEEFLQMIGRAGRNGQPSEGILIWTGSDPIKRALQFKDYFPTKTEFYNQCQKMKPFLPKREGESRYLSLTKLQNVIFTQEKSHKQESKLEGFLGALRVCQMTEEVILNEDYYEIKFLKHTTLEKMLADLPATPTKRSKVLEAVKQLISPHLHQETHIELLLSVKKILLHASLPLNSCEEVFQHYSIQGLIYFVKLDFNQMQLGVIFKNGIKMLESHLYKYVQIRQHFYSSLTELTKFAEAPKCRLKSSYTYFKVPGISHNSYQCLQCDLCEIYTRIACKKS